MIIVLHIKFKPKDKGKGFADYQVALASRKSWEVADFD